MTKFMAVTAILCLSACDATLENAFPKHEFDLNRAGRDYHVTAQYDPVEMAYFTRVYGSTEPLIYEDRADVIALVEQDVGPRLCDGEPIEFNDGMVWGPWGPGLSHYMPDLGAWQIVADCA